MRPGSSKSASLCLLAGFLLVVLTGCKGPGTGTPTKEKKADHLVATVVVERRPVSTAQERPGRLLHRRVTRLHSQEEGRVTRLPVYPGDSAAAGDVLVQLEEDLLRAQLDKARATTEQKRLDLRRLADLVKKRAVSEDDLAQAQTALAVAQAEQRLLETRLTYTRIQAPFAGIVTERLVEPGDAVAKNTHLITLADPDSLYAEAFASELILPHLKTGDPAEIRVDALGDRVLAGRIVRIHPELDRVTRHGIVEIALDPIPTGARAGQFVRATLTTAAVERLLIPFPALRRDRDGEFVLVIDTEGKARRTSVRSGLRTGNQVEVLSGLAPGEQVITRGFLGLSDGQAVRVVPDW